RLTFGRRAMAEVADDVRVIELGERAPFAKQPLEGIPPRKPHDLHRGGHTIRQVHRSIDRTHSTRCSPADDLEAIPDDGSDVHSIPPFDGRPPRALTAHSGRLACSR